MDDQLAAELKGFEVKSLGLFGRDAMRFTVSKDGKELIQVRSHSRATFRQRDGVLFYTHYDLHSSGCKVVAFDLTAKKELWNADLKSAGNPDHSKYHNDVRMEVLDDDTLRVFGNESAGRYVEIVDRTTGKTVGHKVFKQEK